MNIPNLLWSFVSGTAAGMGLGGGTVLLIYLTLLENMPQLKAQGINLLVFVPTAAVAVIIYAFKKKIAWKQVLIMAPLGIIGSFGGTYLLRILPSELLSKILGGVLIIMGAVRLFGKNRKSPESNG